MARCGTGWSPGWTAWPSPTPTAAALTQARRRLGAAPLRALFDLLRGPAATSGDRRGAVAGAAGHRDRRHHDDGARHRRRTWACSAKQAGGNGGSGYPLLRLLAVVCCGTRTIIDAMFGPTSIGETTYAHALLAAACGRA